MGIPNGLRKGDSICSAAPGWLSSVLSRIWSWSHSHTPPFSPSLAGLVCVCEEEYKATRRDEEKGDLSFSFLACGATATNASPPPGGGGGGGGSCSRLLLSRVRKPCLVVVQYYISVSLSSAKGGLRRGKPFGRSRSRGRDAKGGEGEKQEACFLGEGAVRAFKIKAGKCA